MPYVKPKACQKRVLLLTSEAALEAEFRDALRIRQQDGDSALFFELTYLDPTSLTDFFGGPGLVGPRPTRVFRYDTYRACSLNLVALSPFRASLTPSPPFKVFAVGSLLTISRRH